MKLNLGAGHKPIDGYENLDGFKGDSIYPLNFDKNSIVEIRASHVLEHFGHEESVTVLSHWIQALRPGGILKIAVPDFDDLIRRRNMGQKWDFEAIIMGGQVDERDYHKSIWTQEKLRYLMEALGLSDIKTWQSEIADCAAYPFSLNLMGVKRG